MVTFNWKKFIPYVVILLLCIVVAILYYRGNNLKDKFEAEEKLKIALLDTITTYKNSHNELVSEKLTLQASVKELTKMNNYLTASQKDLLARVKEIEKTNTIIAAALIKTNVKIDSLRQGKVTVDTTGGKINISDSLPEIQYSFDILKVKPKFPDQKPIFQINYLSLPNTQFVEFHWKDNRKEGFPVAFSVANSNKYFKTANIDSYVIPEIQKETVKPNFWQKTWKGIKSAAPYLIGGVVGAGTVFLIMK